MHNSLPLQNNMWSLKTRASYSHLSGFGASAGQDTSSDASSEVLEITLRDTPKEAKLHGRQCPFNASLGDRFSSFHSTPPKRGFHHIRAMCRELYQIAALAFKHGSATNFQTSENLQAECQIQTFFRRGMSQSLRNRRSVPKKTVSGRANPSPLERRRLMRSIVQAKSAA